MAGINVLLLGAGGNVSQGILKAIRHRVPTANVVGACVSPYSSGLYMCDKGLISPYARDPEFSSWLASTCDSEGIDIVLTGTEEVIASMVDAADYLLERTDAEFVLPSPGQLAIARNKFATCKWLEKNGLNYPRYCMADDSAGISALACSTGFPLIAKPVEGKGGRGVMLLRCESDIEAIPDPGGYVVEEAIGTQESEFTVGCYCDKGGRLAGAIVMQRRLKNGTTVYARVVDDPGVRSEAERICRAFKPNGPLNVQMRKGLDGVPVCFELNARFSGSTAMRDAFGFRDVEAAIRERVTGEPIDDCFDVSYGEAFRYDNEMYVTGGVVDEMARAGRVASLDARPATYDRSLEVRR